MIWDLKKYGDETALIEGREVLSYAELDEICSRLAEKAEARSLVFILTSNDIGTVAAYVSFLNNGIVPLMLDHKIDPAIMSRMIDSYKPAYIWQREETSYDEESYEIIYALRGYALLQRRQKESLTLHDDLALLISTSGSTGSPKLIRISYSNILSNTASIIEYLKIDQKERAICSLPLNYVYGLSVLNTHLYAGASIVLTQDNCYSRSFWECFENNKCSSFAGIPFMYEMMDKLKFTNKRISTLKTMTQAGGKLSPQLHEKFAAYAKAQGIAFVVMYGASEATARMGYLPATMAIEKKGSMGIAIPGGRFELRDDADEIITDADVSGELLYYGDNVSLGYAEGRGDLAKGDENHGCLRTGDLAYRDSDGYYYIVGRKKRFIKMTGKRTNLSEVEMLIKDRFDIVDAACAGRDDMLEVYITDPLLKEGIADYIYETLKINRHLFSIYVLEQIPKNSSGKVQYAELKPVE